MADRNRIYYQSSMQTEKSQPEGRRVMPKTRFTSFPALSVDPRVEISWSASVTDEIIFLTYYWKTRRIWKNIYNKVVWRPTPNVILRFSLLCVKNACMQMTSLLVSHVSCLSPWARQNFPAPLKIEQTMSHRYEICRNHGISVSGVFLLG